MVKPMRCEEIEVYLSGYVDGELTQEKRQLVRVHLDRCSDCAKVLAELQQVKRSTEQLSFEQPTGEDWIYTQNHIIGRVSRRMGWLVVVTWLVMLLTYTGYNYASNPNENMIEKIIVFGLIVGLGLLLFSVLSERLRERATDRYRGVHR